MDWVRTGSYVNVEDEVSREDQRRRDRAVRIERIDTNDELLEVVRLDREDSVFQSADQENIAVSEIPNEGVRPQAFLDFLLRLEYVPSCLGVLLCVRKE